MTALEQLKALLREWNVPYLERKDPAGDVEVLIGDYSSATGWTQTAPQSPQVEGYPGCYTNFHFAPDGKFLAPDGKFRSVGAWE